MDDPGLAGKVVGRLFKAFEEECLESGYFMFMLREELKRWRKHLTHREEKLHVSFEAEQGIKAKLAPALGLVLTGLEARQESQAIQAEVLRMLEQRRASLCVE